MYGSVTLAQILNVQFGKALGTIELRTHRFDDESFCKVPFLQTSNLIGCSDPKVLLFDFNSVVKS